MVSYDLLLFMLKKWNLDRRNKLHAIPRFPPGSFAVHIGDHLRSNLGSFPVWGSFAVGDHLRRCTGRDFFVFGCSILWAILSIREWRCQDIDQVLLHEIIFFVSAYSAALKCLAKLHPFGSRLQLAGLGKKWEETVKPTCFSLLYVKSRRLRDHRTTDKSFTVFFARWGVKFDRRLKISARWLR